jgi:hypothetical protein
MLRIGCRFGLCNLLFVEEVGQLSLGNMFALTVKSGQVAPRLMHLEYIVHLLSLVDESAVLHLLHLVGREFLLPLRQHIFRNRARRRFFRYLLVVALGRARKRFICGRDHVLEVVVD